MTELMERPLVEQQESVQLMLNLEAAGAVTETSLSLGEMEYDTYEALGVFLGSMKRRTSWWIGDFLVYGEGAFGEKFAQAASMTGLNEQTLLHYQFVARNVPAERRVPTVPFGAHALVARLEPKEQNQWLKKAASKGWGERELRDAMRAKRKDERPQLPIDGEGDTDSAVLVEVARAILRDARPHEDDASLVILPRDDISRLEAALGGI